MTCPYNQGEIPPCLFVSLKKWGYLKDFISGTDKGTEKVSVIHKIKCIQNDGDSIKIVKENCIKCFFCLVNCPDHLVAINKDFSLDGRCSNYNKKRDCQIDCSLLKSLMNLNLIEIPESSGLSHWSSRYSSFEDFASVDEVQNIAVWTISMLKYLSSDHEAVLGREINMLIEDRDRGGRLDVCMFSEKQNLICIETKVNFEKMMQENRYVSQLVAYKKEIANTLKNIKMNIKSHEILLVDGDETKLLYSDHPNCSSNIGNQSAIFYQNLNNYSLLFISAKAMISITLKKMFIDEKKYSIENILNKIETKKCLGMVSEGLIIFENDSYHMIPLDSIL